MEAEEADQHNGDDTAQEYCDEEPFVVVHKVLNDSRPISRVPLPITNLVRLVPKIVFIDQVQGTTISNHYTIDANNSVKEQEQKEELVVVEAYA